DLRAHLSKEIAKEITGLGGPGRPARDPHRTARREGSGEEGSCVREVGFDRDGPPTDWSGVDPPLVRPGLHLHPTGAQRVHGHDEVGYRGAASTDVPREETAGVARGGEEEGGDELGGGGGIHLDLATGEFALTVDGHG